MPDPYAHLAGVYDELVVDPCFASWADFLTDQWRFDPDGVRAVLDVCCGTGLMAAELQSRGYDVAGLDASTQMLVRARERLGPSVELVETFLPRLPQPPSLAGPFDAMVSTFDGFNYLRLPELQTSLLTLAERLRPGGWLVFDVLTDAALSVAADNPVVLGQLGGARYSVTYVVAGRTCRSIMTFEEEGRSGTGFTEEHIQYAHTDDDLRAALTAAGLTVSATTDEYTDVPAGPQTLRQTWVTRRPSGVVKP